MRRITSLLLTLGISFTPLLATAAPAKDHRPKTQSVQASAKVTVVFTTRDREAARTYFEEVHGRGSCPPGLAKKNNGCLPPGQAKKRYAIGKHLSSPEKLQPVPELLTARIGVAPEGYVYGVLDGDLVKLAVGTLLVIDAIEGLVN